MTLDTLLNFDALDIYGFEGFFTDINSSDRILFVAISEAQLQHIYLVRRERLSSKI